MKMLAPELGLQSPSPEKEAEEAAEDAEQNVEYYAPGESASSSAVPISALAEGSPRDVRHISRI